MNQPLAVAAGITVAGILVLVFSIPASAQSPTVHRNPIIVPEDHHDLSPSLREMVKNMPPPSANLAPHAMREHSTGRPRIVSNVPDPVGQTLALPPVKANIGLNFAGVGQGDYGFTDSVSPPDTNAGVGPSQILDWVNPDFAIFDKSTGALIMGPTIGNAFWQGFGGSCEDGIGGDIEARYDQLAGRWVTSQLIVGAAPYIYCVAVSQTSDATGAYYRYAFSTGDNFDDYPKLGIWPDAYYWMYDDFYNNKEFFGPFACALDRTAMLSGQPATMQCFGPHVAESPFLPSDLDGQSLFTPGEPAFYVSLYRSTTLHLFEFHVDFANPNNSTFTGPIPIAVAPYTDNCPYPDECVPEPNGFELEGMSDRPMFRLAYRNFGDHESLTFNHSVQPSVGSQVLGLRWYEIRIGLGTTPMVYQQGTAQSTKYSIWMGSAAFDKAGDLAVGASVSSTTLFPSIVFTGRTPTDPLGALESPKLIKRGGGAEEFFRWGDYSSLELDPSDDCTFWYTTEYDKTSARFNWSTQIASFKFPNCK
jgi:hypothetical protein